MMSDATNLVRTIDGVVRVTDDEGETLIIFTGHDLQAWRRFQLDVLEGFNIVVTDNDMPVQLSKTITGPDRRDDRFVPSG